MHESLGTHEFLAVGASTAEYTEVEARLTQMAAFYGFELAESLPDLCFVRGDDASIRANVRSWLANLWLRLERQSADSWTVELTLVVKNSVAVMSKADFGFFQSELDDLLAYACDAKLPEVDRAAQAAWAAKVGGRLSIGIHSFWAAVVLIVWTQLSWQAGVATMIALYPILVFLGGKIDIPYPPLPLREAPNFEPSEGSSGKGI